MLLAERFQQSTEGHYPLFTRRKLHIYTLAAQLNVARSLAQMGPIYGNTWPYQDKVTRCFKIWSCAVSSTQCWCQAPVPSLVACPSCLPAQPRVLWSALNCRIRTMMLGRFGYKGMSDLSSRNCAVETDRIWQSGAQVTKCPLSPASSGSWSQQLPKGIAPLI